MKSFSKSIVGSIRLPEIDKPENNDVPAGFKRVDFETNKKLLDQVKQTLETHYASIENRMFESEKAISVDTHNRGLTLPVNAVDVVGGKFLAKSKAKCEGNYSQQIENVEDLIHGIDYIVDCVYSAVICNLEIKIPSYPYTVMVSGTCESSLLMSNGKIKAMKKFAKDKAKLNMQKLKEVEMLNIKSKPEENVVEFENAELDQFAFKCREKMEEYFAECREGQKRGIDCYGNPYVAYAIKEPELGMLATRFHLLLGSITSVISAMASLTKEVKKRDVECIIRTWPEIHKASNGYILRFRASFYPSDLEK